MIPAAVWGLHGHCIVLPWSQYSCLSALQPEKCFCIIESRRSDTPWPPAPLLFQLQPWVGGHVQTIEFYHLYASHSNSYEVWLRYNIFVFFSQLSESCLSSSLYSPPFIWGSSWKIKILSSFSSHREKLDSSFKESDHPVEAARSQLLQGKEMWQALFQQHWHQANNNMFIVPSDHSVSSKLRWLCIIPFSGILDKQSKEKSGI